jgi:hypothetical protein
MTAVNFSAEAELFDYDSEAEVFIAAGGRTSRRPPPGYRRFARAADAIRFAIEELPPQLLVGVCVEVAEERFEGQDIRRLYESVDYPLDRRVGRSRQ